MSFRFRHFLVEDSLSAMKVGTDAMLLGSWVHPGNASSILDVGTGCGVLALMMAQVSTAVIDAIDIHGPSATEARLNAFHSPWAERIHVFCKTVEDHSLPPHKTYDIIISNPPFFINSLKPATEKKLLAKHEHALTLETFLLSSLKLMHPGSSLCLILPVRERQKFTGMALKQGLHPVRTLTVQPIPSKAPHRVLMEFRFQKTAEPTEDEMTIYKEVNLFSEQYLEMTQYFHLFNQKTS